MKKQFLNNLSEEEFLKTYWNKKPLLIKKAVKNTLELGSFNEFVDLSKDSEFETRMVYESGGEYPWQAKLGPFKDRDFKKKALWTLIVHNLDLISADFFKLSKNVHFIPRWHFDDVMATVSKKGASVGAHIDDYSVFILQGSGRRKWLLEEKPNPGYIPDLDIRLLAKFNPKIEVILEPGDMLYLPPNVAHHGISLEDSVSYSLGFKSIRYKDLLDVFVNEMADNLELSSFHDKKMALQKNSFQVHDSVFKTVQTELMAELNNSETFKNALLKYLSRPKNEIESGVVYTEQDLLKFIKQKKSIQRDIWAKLALTHKNATHSLLGIGGETYKIKTAKALFLEKIFLNDPECSFFLKESDLADLEFKALLLTLFNSGIFYFADKK